MADTNRPDVSRDPATLPSGDRDKDDGSRERDQDAQTKSGLGGGRDKNGGEQRPEAPATAIALDDEDENADWIKGAWSLPFTSARDLDQLRAYVVYHFGSVEAFMALPIYRLNVKRMPWLEELAKKTEPDG